MSGKPESRFTVIASRIYPYNQMSSRLSGEAAIDKCAHQTPLTALLRMKLALSTLHLAAVRRDGKPERWLQMRL